MKLAVPISAQGEAGVLFKAGATEFYCGFQPLPWTKLFGDHDSVSRRQGRANVSTMTELNHMANETTALSAPLFLTLNGNYTNEQLPYVLNMVESFEEMGGTGIMVMDIALLSGLKKRGCRLILGLSLLAAISNGSALAFYHELGVRRVVFPRFLSPEQMGIIHKQCPDIQAEAIVWLDKCRLIDGYCRFLHCVAYPDCDRGAPSENRYTYDTNYQLPACFELLGTPHGFPACGACSLNALAGAGVTIFKLGGRGQPLDTRLSGVRFLSLSRTMSNENEIKHLYAQTFGAPCCADLCYYDVKKA